MKYQYPQVFKSFIVQLVKSLNIDDRAAFGFLCLGNVPGSKLDGNMATDSELFALIKSLLNADQLSFNNMTLLKYILTSIGRIDLLQEQEKVELQISTGMVLEYYRKFKSVDGFRPDAHAKLPDDSLGDIVEILFTTKEENLGMITKILDQLRQLGDTQQILNTFILNSQLSWSLYTILLVIIGENYSPWLNSETLEDGQYLNWFTKTETSRLLANWMFRNGGLETYREFIKGRKGASISESVLRNIGISLSQDIKLLGDRV
ncbi:uncharacterized protein LOC111342233 [Stylophora pistillata]|uniref:uncharacterized protein LOC111342233 n=1 Tax=Stylophora pistillata TaxID=50429 RepID=UPI000C04E7D0|nr:uncharacterized protein LOC111342233 [Stylophora pistillata]